MRRIKSTLLLALIMVNIINAVSAYSVQEQNIITVKNNSIEWNFIFNTSKINENRYVMLSIDRLGFRYKEQSGTPRGISWDAFKLFIVFIGNERMYYQLVLTENNISIMVDSNIIVNEKYVIVQWINIESKISTLRHVNRTYHKFVLPKTVTLFCGNVNVSVSIGYSSAEVHSLNSNVFEELNIYDIYIEKPMYLLYLEKCLDNASSIRLNPLNTTVIPMYSMIEISVNYTDKRETIAVTISGLSYVDIDNAFKVLPTIIPVLEIALELIRKLDELESGLVQDFAVFNRVDIMGRTLELIDLYAKDKLMLRNVVDVLRFKYDLQDPQIKVELNQSLAGAEVYVEVREQGIVNMSNTVVIQMLSELIKNLGKTVLGLPEGVEDAVGLAKLVDVRYQPMAASSTSTKQNVIFVSLLVLSLSIAQVTILVSALIFILRHWRKR